MYLYGASGHSKVIIDILESIRIKVEGLIDDNLNLDTLLEYPVFHDEADLSPIIVSIGDNEIRKRVAERLVCKFGTAIHAMDC